MDVMCLERLKVIREKIKSCISCGENECPFIKERMNKHFINHHSFDKQNGPAKVYRSLNTKSEYSKLIRNSIIEWSKQLPVYPNQIFEFKKQHSIHLLIERINDMFKSVNDDEYHFKLENIINSFLNSLPGLDGPNDNVLKSDILNRVYRVNECFNKTDKSIATDFNPIDEINQANDAITDRAVVKEVATSTLLCEVLNKHDKLTNTIIDYYNEAIGPELFVDNVNDKSHMKTMFVQKATRWMRHLIDDNFINSQHDLDVNILWDELKLYLDRKSRNDLFKKILIVIDGVPVMAGLETCYKNKIANELYDRLDCIDQEFNDCTLTIKNIINECVGKLCINIDDNTYNEITCVLMDNLDQNNIRIVKDELYSTVMALTMLSDSDGFDLVNAIVDGFEHIRIHSYEHGTAFSGTLSIFTSKHELDNQVKTIVKVNDVPKLSSYEVAYVNKIVDYIDLWLGTLPKEFKSDEKKLENIQYLAREIYDEIRLDDEQADSDKFKTFIIRKWLNGFDFFENQRDAKVYIEDLVNQINDIPKVFNVNRGNVICCGTKIEPEGTMKNLILKYIDNADDDGNGIFADLLKSELPNLCTPTRREVYDSFDRAQAPLEKLDRELSYIIHITECIQDVPLDDTFTDKKRKELVAQLAENIYLVEENVIKDNIDDLVTNFVGELQMSAMRDNKDMIHDIIYKVTSQKQAKTINSTLGDYIETFIRDNYNVLTENEIVLEICSYRLLKEINNLITDEPDAFNTTDVYKRLGDDSIIDGQAARFSVELKYAKEVSDWLHNLPLQAIVNEEDAKARNRKIIELIHKMREFDMNDQSNDVKTKFTNYIERWLLDLDLDLTKDIKIQLVINQLFKRIERINANNRDILKKSSIVCKAPVPCCSYGRSVKRPDPAREMVESIEKWCRELPIDGDTEDVSILKDTIATKIYQKLGDVNNNHFNDEMYRDALEHGIDSILDVLPPGTISNRTYMKNRLLQMIMLNKRLLNEKLSGSEYKRRLENKIAMHRRRDDPEFDIYKDDLAALFILDNFDFDKSKYGEKLRRQIDKHSALRPEMTEEMFVELYGILFQVPIPNDDSVSDEVEEIKTRCEVHMWFDKLPINEVEDPSENRQRHKMISTLAKRLRQIENTGDTEKMHREIMKWLRKLPIHCNEAHINVYANELVVILKSTFPMRKCVSDIDISKLIKTINSRTIVPQSDIPLPDCCQIQETKATDQIVDIVENWCHDLSIPARTRKEIDNVEAFKHNMAMKIIMKISQANPETLDDDLDVILAALPSCCINKDIKKRELIVAIKPLLIDENLNKYRHDLKNVVNNMLDRPKSDLVNVIVDNFIKYHYHKDDAYKIVITEAVQKCNGSVLIVDRLIYELSRVPGPCDALTDVRKVAMEADINAPRTSQKIESARRLTVLDDTGYRIVEEKVRVEKKEHRSNTEMGLKRLPTDVTLDKPPVDSDGSRVSRDRDEPKTNVTDKKDSRRNVGTDASDVDATRVTPIETTDNACSRNKCRGQIVRVPQRRDNDEYNRYQITSDRIPEDCNGGQVLKPCHRVEKSDRITKPELKCACAQTNGGCGWGHRKM